DSPITTTSSLLLFDCSTTTKIYPLSLHDALPILMLEAVRIDAFAARHQPRQHVLPEVVLGIRAGGVLHQPAMERGMVEEIDAHRSEEHTSELQSRSDLVCRLLLEKKNGETEGKTA